LSELLRQSNARDANILRRVTGAEHPGGRRLRNVTDPGVVLRQRQLRLFQVIGVVRNQGHFFICLRGHFILLRVSSSPIFESRGAVVPYFSCASSPNTSAYALIEPA